MSAISRRRVLGTLAASLGAPALLRAAKSPRRLPIAFSTLGCPGWTWPTVLDQADRLGYSGIELRGIQGDMDLPKRPELTGSARAQSRRDLQSRGLVITHLGGSAHMHLKDPKPEGNDHRYVLTGTGVVPVKEQVRVLATNGYKGFYCYEWEKKWHPEIEEPEVAFPHYVKVMTQYLDEAGVKA